MNISYQNIHKRRLNIESVADKYIDKNCKLYLEQFKQTKNQDVLEKFFVECSKSSETANKYSSTLYEYTEKYSSSHPEIKRILIESIAPKLTQYMNAPDYITEQITLNKICDRIWNNHAKIEKSSNITESFKSNSSNTMYIVEKICSTIEKFKLNPIGKVAVALEETNLLYEMYDTYYDKQKMTKDIVSYFVIKDNVNINKLFEAAEKYNNTLGDYVQYIGKELDPIDAFKVSISKDVNTLNMCINEVLSGTNYSRYIFGLGKVLKLLEELMIASDNIELINDINFSSLDLVYDIFYRDYINCDNVKTAVQFTINILDTYIDKYKYLSNDLDDDIKHRLFDYSAKLKDIRDKFSVLNDVIYPEYNMSILNKLSEGVEANTICVGSNANTDYWILPSYARTIGILDNQEVNSGNIPKLKEKLLDRISNIEKSIDIMMKNKGNLLDVATKVENKLFEDSDESIFEVVDINTHRMDSTVALYEVREGVDATIMNSFNDIIKEVNHELKNTGLECYFVNLGIFVEIRVATDIGVTLTESEIEESTHYISDLNRLLIGKILEYSNISDEDIEFMAENADMLLEANDKSKGKDDDESKSGFKGIDLNNIKLFLKGLMDKAKNLSTKEREICRQIDSATMHFCDSVKRAVSADSREQIIKGSVIPSFSKCIKLAIVAAGAFGIASLAGLSSAPLIPVIIIFGAFGASKMLMADEKRALADELEVELEVLDKEISNCEGEGKPKKLRALLRTRKELQRQYQRLKLGNKLAKNLRSSSTGVPKK